MKPTQCIILGGGSSMSEGLSKGLWDKLKDHFVIGINSSYHFFDATLHCYLDRTFYQKQRNDLLKLPLIISRAHKTPEGALPNAIIIPTYVKYNRDLKKGIFKGNLTGIYSLSLAIYLLNKGEIFLLGYDFDALKDKNNNYLKDKKGRLITHWYQNLPTKEGIIIEQKGVGKMNYYSESKANRDFLPFKDEKETKIYNISPASRISIFSKISYDEFFKRLDNKTFNQDKLREEIRKKLSEIKK